MWETITTASGTMWLQTEDGEWINMAHVERLRIIKPDMEERYDVAAETTSRTYLIKTYKTKAEAEHAIERILNPVG